MNTLFVRGCCVWVACVATVLGATGELEETSDQCLSPYFAVQGGESAVESFPLKRTRVEATVNGVVAHVVVHQSYANEGTNPINAKYVFPASTRAAVNGMTMTIGTSVVRAKIQETEQAQATFDRAKAEGKGASLLKQHRPNVFSVDVANIMPGDPVDIELTYTELLVPVDGIYEFVYPTVVGPRYSEQPVATAPPSEHWIQSPYLPEGTPSPTSFDIAVKLSTGIPLKDLACTSHAVTVDWANDSQATMTLKEPKGQGGDRDFILRYRLTGDRIQTGLMLYKGDKENFFLLMAQPPQRVAPEQIPARDYVFVVDVSGSMDGFPLETSKELLRNLIRGLRETDTFNVILFASASSMFYSTPLPATKSNVESAITFIESEQGGGGTSLLPAITKALAIPQPEGVSRSILVITDGYVDCEKETFGLIASNLNQANVFAFGIGSSVNRFLIEGIARAGKGEPFIVTTPAEAASRASAFAKYVGAPVLTDIKATFQGLDVYDLEPASIPDVLADRPILIQGKWRGEATGTVTLTGISGQGAYTHSEVVDKTQLTSDTIALRYLWARARVARLSDYAQDDAEAIREVTSLGLTYDLLTKYTSFVAVDDVVRNPSGAADDVSQPLPLPKGVSNLAVGNLADGGEEAPAVSHVAAIGQSSTEKQVPEPGLWLMMIVAAFWCGITHRMRRTNPSA